MYIHMNISIYIYIYIHTYTYMSIGAICLRYPKEMQRGALTNPNKEIRQKAIRLTKVHFITSF
jgi:hypothetical protein